VRRYLLILGITGTLMQACTPSDQPRFPADEDLELMLRYLVEDGEAKGIVIGLLDSDGSTRVVSYGSAGAGRPPLGTRSSFEIGSITKVFTATLLADMVARGDVALDDPVSKYLPPEVVAPTFGGRAITLVDLATHTSGLSDAVLAGELASRGVNDPLTLSVDMLYRALSEHKLEREPGTLFEYSNAGMGLLGHALARAAGTSLRALIKERVLDPLGMNETGYALEEIPEGQLTQGHAGDQAIPPVVVSEALEGAGGLRSNIEDMLRFLAANVGDADTELERAMRQTHEPLHPIGLGNRHVGLAWLTYTLNRHTLVVHNGDTDGFTARMAFDPENDVGVVVLTNSKEYDNSLGSELLVHSVAAVDEVTPSPEALAGLAGTYSIDFIPWYVRLEDEGYLTVQPTTDVRMRLYAASDTLFFTKREEWSFAFPTDTIGDKPEILFYVNGKPRSGVRVDVGSPPSRATAGNLGIPVSEGDVARYEGVYDVVVGSQTPELSVYGAEATGRLMSDFLGATSRLIPVGEHEFTVVYNPTIRLVFTLQGERVEGVTLRQGDRSDSGVRRR